jgi:hypothetical protein
LSTLVKEVNDHRGCFVDGDEGPWRIQRCGQCLDSGKKEIHHPSVPLERFASQLTPTTVEYMFFSGVMKHKTYPGF